VRTIVFYISGHGFGHASRDIEVINALLAHQPWLKIVVRTSVAEWLFRRTVRGSIEYAPLVADPGAVQIDSLSLDADETVRRATAYARDLDRAAAQEADVLRALRADFVIADIPPLGLAAASVAGIPSVGFGNFTWDWIYAAYPGGEEAAARIGDVYEGTRRALRLPMWGGFERFGEIVDLPFVARHSTRDPEETRRALGLPLDERLALVSFGGYGVDRIDLDALGRVRGYRVLVSTGLPVGEDRRPLSEADAHGSLLPLNEPAMYDRGFRYEDLVRAVDVVVTKPGYGIIAECLANDTALLYTSRGHFVEYDVLVAAMPRFLRAAFIDHDDLFAGRWEAHLDALLMQPEPPETPATSGADVAARWLLSGEAER
jgi:L-arabinokinase